MLTVKWFKSFIWLIDGTLTGTITPGQCGPGNNGNERLLHIPQSSRTRASLSDYLLSYPGYFLLRRNAVVVLCSYSRPSCGWKKVSFSKSLKQKTITIRKTVFFIYRCHTWRKSYNLLGWGSIFEVCKCSI